MGGLLCCLSIQRIAASPVLFASVALCDAVDSTQSWAMTIAPIAGTKREMSERSVLSLADGACLALRDSDVFPGAQILMADNRSSSCSSISFAPGQSGDASQTMTFVDHIGWCIGLPGEGCGPGVGAWPCGDQSRHGRAWIRRPLSSPDGDHFALELLEARPLPRRCLALRMWGSSTDPKSICDSEGK